MFYTDNGSKKELSHNTWLVYSIVSSVLDDKENAVVKKPKALPRPMRPIKKVIEQNPGIY